MKRKAFTLLPLLLLTGCGQIEELNYQIYKSTEAINNNRAAVQRSTEVIRENGDLIDGSTSAIKANHQALESMNR